MSDPIKVITEPTVRLVGRQVIDEAELSAFLKDEDAETWTTDTDVSAEKIVEVSGRICYRSYSKPRPGGNAAYLNHILEVGHGSVIEHAVYNFIITGVSRSLTHEWVRHRAGWSYSQRSQRFIDEGDLSAVVPPALAAEVDEALSLTRQFGVSAHDLLQTARIPSAAAGAGRRWLASMEKARRDYSYLADYLASKTAGQPVSQEERTLRRKRAREAARSVLPNATATEIFVTANARALRTFIEQRGDEHADAEIRRVAFAMLGILQADSPNLFGDYVVTDRPGVGQVISTPYHKV
jgi:thymidylate synthase (FAD)